MQSAQWMRKAAEAGDAVAMFNVGAFCFSGHAGVNKNEAEGVEWFHKAALAGYPTAMYNFAICLINGTGGIPKDQTAAVAWLQKSASLGSVDAQTLFRKIIISRGRILLNLLQRHRQHLQFRNKMKRDESLSYL